MKNKLFILSLLVFTLNGFSQKNITTRFEASGGNETPEYHEIISWWKNLEKQSPMVKIKAMGPTDSGFPLHLVMVSGNKVFDIPTLKKQNKRIILVNNGIHPGEPDGIDASMLLVRDIVAKKIALPDNVVLAIIPVYNIGGALNRSEFFRVDQNGPEAFGSRGNARNYDLNRDFIKNDTRNARSFVEIFHYCDPDVFVDNHVSNGADYQHVMTLIPTQHSKLGGKMGAFMNEVFEPWLYKDMEEKNFPMIPYVSFVSGNPERGWSEFFETPRYSTGYAALWHTFAFMPETHMLKPYKDRVTATYELMRSFIQFTSEHSDEIARVRRQQKEEALTKAEFPIFWQMDREKKKQVYFKGYEAGYKTSEVSGLPRLYYDRNKPYEKWVGVNNVFNPVITVKKPDAYVIPQGWWQVIDLLKLNGVKMQPIARDTMINVEVYHIEDFTPSRGPYEGHYNHSNVKIKVSRQDIHFRKGDWLIPMNQDANRFLIEVLEPQAHDSYFSWNFFDPILNRKEGFASYNFEDVAAEYLKANPKVREMLEAQKSKDTAFAKNASAQLNFVYQNSPYSEPEYRRYPVYRIIN